MKNLTIVIILVGLTVAGLTSVTTGLIFRSFPGERETSAPATLRCVDSAELSIQGVTACAFPEQRIEVWPVAGEGILHGAKILIKCTCPRSGAK